MREELSDVNVTREETDDDTTSEDGIIEFVCAEEDYGAIEQPIPANKVLPDWYRMLEGKMGEGDGLGRATVKRCMPFLDALSMGWIIPLAGEVEFSFDEESGAFEFKSQFRKPLLETHNPEQLGGDTNPMTDMPIIKFMNRWSVKVPEGYSILYTSPLNRAEDRFKAFSGVVDVDNYFNEVNFPALWTGGTYQGVLESGTPIVQAIPFKRDNGIGDAIIRPMDEKEERQSQREDDILGLRESMYRNERWQPKTASREVHPGSSD